jgi:hypothetical protein
MRGRGSFFVAVISSLLAIVAACTGLKPRVFDAGTTTVADAGADAGSDAGADAGPENDCDAGAKPLGCGCLAEGECQSGICTNLVCCDTVAASCSGCRACFVEGHVGTCTLVPRGADPNNACTENTSSCAAGFCDGDGGCAPVDAGVQCSSPVCVNTVATGQYASTNLQFNVCDGLAMNFCPFQQASCADGGICESASSCKQSCGVDADCVQGFYCGADGGCQPLEPNGATCPRDSACASNVCKGNGSCRGCATNRDCTPSAPHCSSGECSGCLPGDFLCEDAGFGSCSATMSGGLLCACSGASCKNARAPRCNTTGLPAVTPTCVCGNTGGPCPRDAGTICTGETGSGVCKVAPGNPCLKNEDCVVYCDAGRCSRLPSGFWCRDNSDCVTNSCIDGKCA